MTFLFLRWSINWLSQRQIMLILLQLHILLLIHFHYLLLLPCYLVPPYLLHLFMLNTIYSTLPLPLLLEIHTLLNLQDLILMVLHILFLTQLVLAVFMETSFILFIQLPLTFYQKLLFAVEMYSQLLLWHQIVIIPTNPLSCFQYLIKHLFLIQVLLNLFVKLLFDIVLLIRYMDTILQILFIFLIRLESSDFL